jgi:hypothetical protein
MLSLQDFSNIGPGGLASRRGCAMISQVAVT